MSATELAWEPAPSPWMRAVQHAFESVATTALSWTPGRFITVPAPTEVALAAYIPIISADSSIQVGIVVDESSARLLASALLQLGVDELAPADVTDAVGEIANMVAGVAKAAMATPGKTVALGLPLVVHGWVDSGGHRDLECARVSAGTASINIVIIQPTRSRS